MNFMLSLMVLSSVFAMRSAIVSLPSLATSLADNVKKEKRGIFGLGVHGDLSFPPNHHQHVHAPSHLGTFNAAHVNLGAHFHTTVTRKIGVPIPYPYPVPVYKPYPVPVDRPVPVAHYVPHIGPVPTHPHHIHHPWHNQRW